MQEDCWNSSIASAGCDPDVDDACLCGPFFHAVTTCLADKCSVNDNLGKLVEHPAPEVANNAQYSGIDFSGASVLIDQQVFIDDRAPRTSRCNCRTPSVKGKGGQNERFEANENIKLHLPRKYHSWSPMFWTDLGNRMRLESSA